MKNNKYLPYLIDLIIALVIFFIGAFAWDLFGQTELKAVMHRLSDCFFLPGAFFTGIALIGWIGSKGTFDIFGYSVKGLFSLWKTESYYKQTPFYEYRAAKDQNRKSFNLPMLVVGLTFLAIGILCTIIYAAV